MHAYSCDAEFERASNNHERRSHRIAQGKGPICTLLLFQPQRVAAVASPTSGRFSPLTGRKRRAALLSRRGSKSVRACPRERPLRERAPHVLWEGLRAPPRGPCLTARSFVDETPLPLQSACVCRSPLTLSRARAAAGLRIDPGRSRGIPMDRPCTGRRRMRPQLESLLSSDPHVCPY